MLPPNWMKNLYNHSNTIDSVEFFLDGMLIIGLLQGFLSYSLCYLLLYNHGKLVPESIIFGLLSKRLEDGHDRGENGFILDGIPRTRLQAEILDQLVDIDLVVNFKCSEDHFQAAGSPSDSVVSRKSTKSSFSTLSNTTEEAKPKVSTFYREQMQFLEDYYQNQKKLIDFQVGSAPGETWKGLLAALHLQHINAVRSSQTLTTGLKVS